MSQAETAEPEWLRARLRRHFSELVRLAVPVIGSRAGILMLMTVDFATLGRAGAAETAYYSLGASFFIFLMVTGVGLMFGSAVVTTHRLGAGDDLGAGSVWRRAQPWAFMLGVCVTAPTFFGEAFFLAVGVVPDLAEGAGRVTLLLGLGLMPTLLYISSAFFLEALRRPVPVFLAILAANIVNLALNPILVFGAGPVPAMGADGAALSTTLVRLLMAVILFGYIWWLADRDRFGIRRPLGPGGIAAKLARWWRNSREQRNYGYASGAAYGFESLSFSVMQVYAGWIGHTASAVFGLGMNLTALLFMGGLGLATATAVRVGIAHGRRDLADRTLAGWTGLAVTILLMGIFCLVLTLAPDFIAGLYTVDPLLLPVLIPAVFLIGFIMLGDGAQIVLSNALRASADPWTATLLNFTSYFCVQIPLGYLLAIHWDRGVQGLFEAIAIAAGVSVTLLLLRWIFLCRRGMRG